MTLTSEELVALGEAWEKAWGRWGWQAHVARELPCHPVTVRRWKGGQRVMMPALEPRVREILESRPAMAEPSQ